MKTETISAHHGATIAPARSVAADRRIAALRPRRDAFRLSPAKAQPDLPQTQAMPDFSPLVQEFLDECGYSDK